MIKVMNRYIVNASSDCFTVMELITNEETGKQYEKKKTYHDTLEQCFMNIYKRETRRELDSNAWEAEAYLIRVQAIQNDLSALFKRALGIELKREPGDASQLANALSVPLDALLEISSRLHLGHPLSAMGISQIKVVVSDIKRKSGEVNPKTVAAYFTNSLTES